MKHIKTENKMFIYNLKMYVKPLLCLSIFPIFTNVPECHTSFVWLLATLVKIIVKRYLFLKFCA